MTEWTLRRYKPGDKQLVIEGPLHLYIDYDDVDHARTLQLTQRLAEWLTNSFAVSEAERPKW